MPDFASLKGLGKLTALSAEKGIAEWFPPEYSQIPEIRAAQRVKAAQSFVFGPLRTEDVQEHSGNPIKSVPRLPYMEKLVEFHMTVEDLIVPKVRRMIMTLGFQGGSMWKVLERPSKKIAFVYNDLEQGEDMIDANIRAVMWDSMPDELKLIFNIGDKSGIFQVVEKRINGLWKPWRSEIKPFPAKPKDLRGYGGDIFWDEFSTHPDARECAKAISPARVGRSKFKGQRVLLGTVNPMTPSGRYFMELYEHHNLKRARMMAKYGLELPEKEEVVTA